MFFAFLLYEMGQFPAHRSLAADFLSNRVFFLEKQKQSRSGARKTKKNSVKTAARRDLTDIFHSGDRLKSPDPPPNHPEPVIFAGVKRISYVKRSKPAALTEFSF